jgi:hypothetical protein
MYLQPLGHLAIAVHLVHSLEIQGGWSHLLITFKFCFDASE